MKVSNLWGNLKKVIAPGTATLFLGMLIQGSSASIEVKIPGCVEATWEYKSPLPELVDKVLESISDSSESNSEMN